MFNELKARQLLVDSLNAIKKFMEVQDGINVNLQDRIQVLEDRLLVLEEDFRQVRFEKHEIEIENGVLKHENSLFKDKYGDL